MIKTVARAVQDGAYRDRIVVRNEVSRESYFAIVTGPDTVELAPTTDTESTADRERK
jgi:flagella basal body P-ring formation protein FlgA